MYWNSRARQAFTLIELLIVVAILAILSAIAIPNFLDAQVRARVAQAQADMRSCVTAVESYRVDHGALPLADDGLGLAITPYPPAASGPPFSETTLSQSLTTPIAYLASLPEDPFAANEREVEESPRYGYATRSYAAANGGPLGEIGFLAFGQAMSGVQISISHFVASHGPDADTDTDPVPGSEHFATLYDPTNGTHSNGEIVWMEPGGFAGL